MPPNTKPTQEDDRPVALLPGGSVELNQTAEQLGRLLDETGRYFCRGSVVVKLGQDENGSNVLKTMKPAHMPSAFESVARLCKLDKDGHEISTTCSKSNAELIMHAEPFLAALPPIHVVTNCPVLIERDGKLIQVHEYDRESGILAGGEEVPNVSLDEAKRLLTELLSGFNFVSPSDKSRALAMLISPALVFGGLLGGRAPLFLMEADKSQTGKGFLVKIMAATFGGGLKIITQRKGGVGSLDESLSTALIKGGAFISLDNLRGKTDSPAIESLLTEDTFQARTPYSENIEIDVRRVIFTATSNRAEFTTDLSNRSSVTRLLKQPDGHQFRKYNEGDILDHVPKHSQKYLAAIFAVVREWHDQGKLRTDETAHSFRSWVQTLDWIVQHILDEAPLMEDHKSAQARIANPALTWLRDVAMAVVQSGQTDEWIRTNKVLDILEHSPEDIEIPGLKDGCDLADEGTLKTVWRELGKKLGRCFHQSEDLIQLDNLHIERQEYPNDRAGTTKEYRFSLVSPMVPHAPLVAPLVKPLVSPVAPVGSEHFHTNEVTDEEKINMLGAHEGHGGHEGNTAEMTNGRPQVQVADTVICSRCTSRRYVDTEIDGGDKVRRDCADCDLFIGFVRWDVLDSKTDEEDTPF